MSMNGSVLSPLRRDTSNGCVADLKATTRCLKLHLNSLWSVWYGICVSLLNIYIGLQCSRRYFDFESIPWPAGSTPPTEGELHLCIGLTALSVLLVPFFFVSAVFKIGNLANDGFKLGQNLSSCSADAAAGVLASAKNGCHRLWQHCGPTSSLFHITMAFCVLIPKLIMEARLIQSGLASKQSVWKTDLDFLISHRDPVITLNFTPSYGVTSENATSAGSNSSVSLSSPNDQPRPMALAVAIGQEILLEDNTNVMGSVSIEYLNYVLAWFVYSIRYPSVFWATNKCFGILFSLQLLVNSIQCLLLQAGVSVLYKIHVVGAREALPYLMIHLNKWATKFGKPFVLNKEVTITFYMMSTFLILVSSLVLYLYGYGRLSSFLNKEHARRVISIRNASAGRAWGYFTHCVALCVLVAIGVCEAPLIYDFSIAYRGSLDFLILIVILSSILHMFLWVFLWLVLTLKQHWEFKLRVTIGHAAVRSAQSIKLVTDVQLISNGNDQPNAPLLVVGHGKTYTVSDGPAKRSIMAAIQKAALDKKVKVGQGNFGNRMSDDGEEQIYWLRPKSRTPRTSPDSSGSEITKFGWFTKRRGDKARADEMIALNSKRTNHRIVSSKNCGDDDDVGDYVRLREIPLGVATPKGEHSDDTTSEDNKLLESVRNDTVTYASVNKDLLNPGIEIFEDPSPLVTPEPEDHDDLPPPPPELSAGLLHHSCENQGTNKCLFRADSGMAPEEIPSHSDSEVSGGSPPDRCSNSETSSGIHSNSSRDSSTNQNICNGSIQKAQSQQWVQCQPTPYICNNRIYKPQQHYAVANKTPAISEVEENTVIVRRNSNVSLRSQTIEPSIDRFSRSTNMRMSSFTDGVDKTKCSATLPHYPTQPVVTGEPYSHCSTMPLPVSVPATCGVPFDPPKVNSDSFPRPHTTIPLHHNGVRLCNPANQCQKRYFPPCNQPSYQHHAVAFKVPHCTFPQNSVYAKFPLQQHNINFSMSTGNHPQVNITATKTS